MFIKNLQKIFLFSIVIGTILLVYLWYQDYSFSKNPLSQKYQNQITEKHKELKILAKRNFNINRDFTFIISDKMDDSKYGMATFDKNGQIKIYLNKKRFKENSKYMINDVFPHEYAHAIMFHFRDFSKTNSGHTKRWQNICRKLNGLRCDRFVNHKDILIEKTNFFN